MLAFRYFVVVSVGTVIALGYGMSAKAQELSVGDPAQTEPEDSLSSPALSPSKSPEETLGRFIEKPPRARVAQKTETLKLAQGLETPSESAPSAWVSMNLMPDLEPVPLKFKGQDELGAVVPSGGLPELNKHRPTVPSLEETHPVILTTAVDVDPVGVREDEVRAVMNADQGMGGELDRIDSTTDDLSLVLEQRALEVEPDATEGGVIPPPNVPQQAESSPPRVEEGQLLAQTTDDRLDELQDELTNPSGTFDPSERVPSLGLEEVEDQAAPLQAPGVQGAGLSDLERLNPSANPLFFPTQPEEVTVDLSRPITLQEAIALARRNNPQLQAARLNIERAQAGLRASLAAWYPNLDLTMSLSRNDSASGRLQRRTPFGQVSGGSSVTDSFDAGLELVYNLYNGGRRNAQIRQAEEQIRLNRLEWERVSEQIRFNTTNAYYALQEADATVNIEQASVEQAQQTLRDAELLEQAGLGTRFDVLRAQVELANSNQSLTRARAAQSIARRQLVQELALGQTVEVTIADEIQPAGQWEMSLEESIIQAYKNRAELEQQLVQREINEQQRRAALADLRPQINLRANANMLGVFGDGLGPAGGYSLRAEFRWRLFDGGLARANSEAEEIDIELAEVEFERQRNIIRGEVEEAFFNLQANGENIRTATAAVQLAEESLRLARLRFTAGVGTQTDVINAQSELTRARGNLLAAIVTYNRALSALQRAVSNYPDDRLFNLP
ncbi:TolC family protein [Spirulina subsalsa FACHB-351]|uniref:TolC family protein n=1 Tax=Spirulina subsalsa FACHB-351 TaxID=234711 RepID=A0ABT3L8D0_9CYAN|nr:TolC family protein [Spirulina subsalsa]MCW6037758.1 TolC family protein [Spirulina subsalsa FACHB-351]